MLRILFLLFIILSTIYGLKYTIYLNRFQEYTPLAFLGVLFYILSIILRSFTYTRGKNRETIILFLYHGLMAPFFFYTIDFFFILRWIIKKESKAITDFLSVRVYELIILLVGFVSMGFVINPMTKWIFIILALYTLFSFIFLYLKKSISLDIRVILYTLMSSLLLLLSLNIGKHVLFESWQFVGFNHYYFPVIEDTMRLSHFSHLIMSIFLLSSALSDPKGDQE